MNKHFLSLQAPCKINLHLKVLEKRADGFHNLESIFALLDFADTLDCTVLPGKTGVILLRTECSGPCAPFAGTLAALPPEKNLVYRAVSLFREETGFDQDVSIMVHKRIPPGSGLGGASSCAAAALSALNRLAGNPFTCDQDKLLSLASRLGSDVPFFLYKAGAAWVSGRGEFVEPLLPLDGYGLILAFPPFQNVTAEAFALLDENRTIDVKRENLPETGKSGLLAALDMGCWPFHNDFLSLFLEKHSVRGEYYASVLDALETSGALFSSLSGSGSACFGVYKDRETAEKTVILPEKKDFYFQSTFFLRSGV